MKNGDCSENIHYLIEFVAYVTGGEKRSFHGCDIAAATILCLSRFDFPVLICND